MLAHQLLQWFIYNQRVLPFRETRDPYRIWVSEIMLQQTQVDTVIPYYNRFMNRFPTVFALAKASEDEVFKLWEGLGYYSRAKNLLKCAKQLVNEYHGVFPKDYQAVLKLPGIGPYTAGAVLGIAYNLPYPAVDGNVMRVISRLYDMEEDISHSKTRGIFEKKVLEIMPEDVRNFNQALMELGALVCLPKNPHCENCPLSELCLARKHGTISLRPVKTKKIVNEKLYAAVGIIKKDNKFLLVNNNAGLLSGLWGFPILEAAEAETSEGRLLTHIQEKLGFHINAITPIGEAKHVFTHKTWQMRGYLVEVEADLYTGSAAVTLEDNLDRVHETYSDWIWAEREAISNYAVSTALKQIIKLII